MCNLLYRIYGQEEQGALRRCLQHFGEWECWPLIYEAKREYGHGSENEREKKVKINTCTHQFE